MLDSAAPLASPASRPARSNGSPGFGTGSQGPKRLVIEAARLHGLGCDGGILGVDWLPRPRPRSSPEAGVLALGARERTRAGVRSSEGSGRRPQEGGA